MRHSKTEREENAIKFARSHKRDIARTCTDLQKYPADAQPVSVFMAGSPGAGKTESSKNLIARLTGNGHTILRIDPDELREHFTDYNGTNSQLFQGATSILADCLHDHALKNNQSFVFDGTLTNLKRAQENISRSLKHKRLVQILYVYQDPIQAWRFVKARENEDGRHVPIDAFITQYFEARQNVNTLKKECGKQIKLDILVKNVDGSDFSYRENISLVDSYVRERYSKEDLKMKLL